MKQRKKVKTDGDSVSDMELKFRLNRKIKLSVYYFLGLATNLKCSTSKKEVGKGNRRMPWLSKAKKDVISCDKLRGGANDL